MVTLDGEDEDADDYPVEEETLDEETLNNLQLEVERIERTILEAKQKARRRKSATYGVKKEKKRMSLAEVARMERASYFGEEDVEVSMPATKARRRFGLGISRGISSMADDSVVKGEEDEEMSERRRGADMSPEKAMQIAHAAEELAEALSATVGELMARKEEADRIHDLLVLRAEKASERILFLEYRIAEMEDDFSANQSELKFLRIQLQALEAQCDPREIDAELVEGIMNWKIDWEDIQMKSKARRRRSGAPLVGGGVDRGELERRMSDGVGIKLRREFVGGSVGVGGEGGDVG